MNILWFLGLGCFFQETLIVKGERVSVICLNPSYQNYAIKANNVTVCPEMFYFVSDGGISTDEGIEIDGSLRITAPVNYKYVNGMIYEADGKTAANYIVTEKGSSSFQLGDVDGNGRVTIKDVLCIQRKLADMELPFEFDIKRADVDGDGKITINDATAIQYYLAEMKTSYPIGETKS